MSIRFDDKGKFRAGWVTVLIVPESKEDKPKLPFQLKNHVTEYLKEHAANVVVSPEHLQVTEPMYVGVSVDATIIAILF